MASYTIKAYLQKQAKNKQGLVPVYLRYYYNKKQSTHPLGVSVKEKDFNEAGQGSFRASCPAAAENNTKLLHYIECLDVTAAAMEEPGWTKVKSAFLVLLSERQAQAQAQREDREWKHKVLHELREGLDRTRQNHQDKVIAFGNTLSKVDTALVRIFPDATLSPLSRTLVEQQELTREHALFHEQAKRYVKQFLGMNASQNPQHLIQFEDGSELRLDMNVPAHAWYKTLLEFENYTGYRCTYSSIDRAFYHTYSDFLWDVKDYEDASHFNHVSRLKMFLSESVTLGLSVNPFFRHKSFKTYKKAKPIHALKEEELDALLVMDFADEHLNRVRDIFCFQACTGMRYVDLRMKQEVKNERVVGKTQKTSGNYSIPLALYPDGRLSRLGEAYDWDFKMDKNRYRLSIKVMMHSFYAARGTVLRVDKYIYKRGKAFIDPATGRLPTEPLAEAFSSHNARKTFCTVMFLKGYTVEMVAKMIGSKRQDVLRDNYIGFIDSDLDKMIKNSEAEKELRGKVARQETELVALRKLVSM